ncbi:MAG: Rpn family recombination-promoting nuclease/putative transposase [Clostridium sp.]
MVLYNGKSRWNAKINFADMMDGRELFGDNILNFKYDIFDINNTYTKEELLNNKNMTSAIFLLDQKINPVEFLERIKSIALYFKNLTNHDKILIKKWIRNTVEDEVAVTAIDILSATQEEVEKMVASNATMLKDWKEEAKKQGLLEGKLEGKLEERYELATNLLDILDDETIALKTKLPIDEVIKLRAKSEANNH